MPTYQYACTSQACGLRFERVQTFTDPSVTECPECSDRVRKVYGSVGVVFKGSGFYRTDSRDARSGAAAKADSDGSAGGKSAEPSKAGAGSNAGKAGSSSGSASSGESKSDGKSAASSKPAAPVPS